MEPTKTVGVRVGKADHMAYRDKQVLIFQTEGLTNEARFAMELIERWGLVAAMPDGEDSSGRAKLRLPTPQELVTRAFNIAAEAMSQARSRGHTFALPDLNQINAAADAAAAAVADAKSA